MNWKSGIFRLWFAGSLLWTAYWAKQYLCLEATALFDFECGGGLASLLDYAVGGLGVVLAIWVARGFFSSPPHELEVIVTRRPNLRRVAAD